MNSLPTDILELIFAHIPIRMRLLYLAPVCKRWRIATLNSVTQLPLVLSKYSHLVLPRFSRLTTLEWNVDRTFYSPDEASLVGVAFQPKWLAPTISHVTLGPNDNGLAAACLSLPAIRSLKLTGGDEDAACIARKDVLQHVQSTLTSLSLEFHSDTSTSVWQYPWPQLSSISISRPSHFLISPSLATQLVSLTIEYPNSFSLDESIRFPRLSSLAVGGSHALLLSLVTRCASLEHLHVSTRILRRFPWPLVSPLLESLRVWRSFSSLPRLQPLLECTRLKSLDLRLNGSITMPFLVTLMSSPLCSSLTSITLDSSEPVSGLLSLLYHFPNLRALSLRGLVLPPRDSLVPTLLREFSCLNHSIELPEAYDILSWFPRLHFLRFSTTSATSYAIEATLISFLQYAEKQGVSRVAILFRTHDELFPESPLLKRLRNCTVAMTVSIYVSTILTSEELSSDSDG